MLPPSWKIIKELPQFRSHLSDSRFAFNWKRYHLPSHGSANSGIIFNKARGRMSEDFYPHYSEVTSISPSIRDNTIGGHLQARMVVSFLIAETSALLKMLRKNIWKFLENNWWKGTIWTLMLRFFLNTAEYRCSKRRLHLMRQKDPEGRIMRCENF